ncbi:MAG: glycine cleavage T C-terminal barrel domain-containing protein [Tepidisphaeraceae bacterium]
MNSADVPDVASPLPLSNPLRELHGGLTGGPLVEFQPYDRVEIVSTFGEPQAEYATIRKSCGLMDLPQRGFLELIGRDRLPFLNNLLTNQTWDKQAKSGMQSGAGVYAFFLNVKGRIAADMNVLDLGDRTLLEMDGRVVETVKEAFARYLFAEQVTMRSLLGVSHEIALHGPTARQVLETAAGAPVPELGELASASLKLFGVDATVWRDDPTGSPGYHLILPIDGAPIVWREFIARFGASESLGKRPLRPIGWAAFNATRIEAGRPLFGIDFDDSILPAETGVLFPRAVSLTKGCYLGQEIVARMHARQQVAKQIVGIKLDTDDLPIAGAKLFDEKGNEIGGITSSTLSPMLSDTAICLGYVKRPFVATGTKVRVPAEGALREATVTELPFVSHASSEHRTPNIEHPTSK